MSPAPFLFLAQAQTQAPADDIRDIRGLIPIPSLWDSLRWAVLALVVIALAWAGWQAWRRRARKVAPPYPLQVALAELEKARALLRPETAREFSTAVSGVVRYYIEVRFAAAGVHAAHRTTEEFLRDLAARSDSPLAAHRGLLEEFLQHCDLAKFGRWSLETAQMEAMLQSARTFLVDIQPKPEAAAKP